MRFVCCTIGMTKSHQLWRLPICTWTHREKLATNLWHHQQIPHQLQMRTKTYCKHHAIQWVGLVFLEKNMNLLPKIPRSWSLWKFHMRLGYLLNKRSFYHKSTVDLAKTMTPLWRNKEGCNSGNSTQISQTGEEEYEHLLWKMQIVYPYTCLSVNEIKSPNNHMHDYTSFSPIFHFMLIISKVHQSSDFSSFMCGWCLVVEHPFNSFHFSWI